jgi:hypothetical protein
MLLALYLGETSRGRLSAMLVTPRVAITVPPWALCMVSGKFSGDWAALSPLDGLASIGDVMGVWLLLRGAPGRRDRAQSGFADVVALTRGLRSFRQRVAASNTTTAPVPPCAGSAE